MRVDPCVGSSLAVNLCALFYKLNGFFLHAGIQCLVSTEVVLTRIVTHILGDFHRAKVRATHGAEVGHFCRIFWQGFVVVFTGTVRVEADVELVFPAEFKTCLAHGIVADLGAGVALGQIGRMRRNFVRDNADAYVFFIGQAMGFSEHEK